MSTPGSRWNDKVVKQNGDPGDHLSVFTNTQTPAGSAEARLMFAFKKDTDTRKAYLAGRGKSARTSGMCKKNQTPQRV